MRYIIPILIALCLGGLGFASLTNAQTAITPHPSPTPICAGLLRNRLIVYERGRVTSDDPSPLNVRAAPGTNGEIIGMLPAHSVFFVLEGPRCTQRYMWYRIKSGDLEGWIAEGTTNRYYVEPYLNF